jgi:hypothetical protein
MIFINSISRVAYAVQVADHKKIIDTREQYECGSYIMRGSQLLLLEPAKRSKDDKREIDVKDSTIKNKFVRNKRKHAKAQICNDSQKY